jgi:RNA polymerase sigma factor for flagellar operon FliA
MSLAAAQFAVRRVRMDAGQRERVLLEHLPQVRSLARRIHCRLPAQVPLEDLVHAGVIGLIDAVDNSTPANKSN